MCVCVCLRPCGSTAQLCQSCLHLDRRRQDKWTRAKEDASHFGQPQDEVRIAQACAQRSAHSSGSYSDTDESEQWCEAHTPLQSEEKQPEHRCTAEKEPHGQRNVYRSTGLSTVILLFNRLFLLQRVCLFEMKDLRLEFTAAWFALKGISAPHLLQFS